MRYNEESHAVPFVVLVGVLVLMLSGCSNDLYADCDLDQDLDCSDGDAAYSCVQEPTTQCSTRVCGRYQQSRAFCTQRCQSDGDCAGGSCEQFILGDESKYCVPSNFVDE